MLGAPKVKSEARLGSRRRTSAPEVTVSRRTSSHGPGRRTEHTHRRTLAPGPDSGRCRSESPAASQIRQIRSKLASATHAEVREAPPAEKIVACFKTFDINGDGVITLDELMTVMKRIDQHGTLNDSDIQCVLSEIDSMGDGHIDYAEFVDWIKKGDSTTNTSKQLYEHSEHVINAESPEERLERCLEELRAGEKAALPPKLTAVEFQGSDDLWMFKTADDKAKEARKYEQWNRVIRISPSSKPYKAGVRIGWYVLEIGDLCITETTEVPSCIVSRYGGGGGAKRSVTVRFISPECLEFHRAAIAALPALRDAVEDARAVCRNKDPGCYDFSLEVVKIKYFNYKLSCPAPGGRVLTAEIDQFLGLSALMPVCALHLAEWREGDQHLASTGEIDSTTSPLVGRCHTINFKPASLGIDLEEKTGRVTHVVEGGQAAREGVKSGWVIDLVSGQKYKAGALDNMLAGGLNFSVTFTDKDGFSGLVLGRTYFLIVEMAAAMPPAEVKWRARMKKDREVERLAALPPHDCEKMQVPLNLIVETHHGEFLVEIDNSEGKTLGMNMDEHRYKSSLVIEEILWYGIIHRWNLSFPTKALKEGDHILEVNGVRGDNALLLEELRKKQILHIMARRFDFYPGDRVRALFGGMWWDACVKHDNRNGTFTVIWTDGKTIGGREEDTIKTPSELYKAVDASESRHIKVDGDYSFCGGQHRPEYVNGVGTQLFFKSEWQIASSKDSFRCFYSLPGETDLLPPAGAWTCPTTPGCVANVTRSLTTGCLICTESLRRE